MKILFICGSMEPGRDGVGDYVRALGTALVKMGHAVQVVALHDRFCAQVCMEAQPAACSLTLPVMRLPSLNSAIKSTTDIYRWIADFDPDWISLQYVPFAFHQKGLPLRLPTFVAALTRHRKLHIMFHELWIGMDRQSSWRHLLLGFCQKNLLQWMVAHLKPNCVDTQTHFYQQVLKAQKIGAGLLPLFSNIHRNGAASDAVHTSGALHFILFGHLHPSAPVGLFAQEVANFAKAHHVEASLTIVGHNGAERDHWVSAWKNNGLPVRVLGMLPESKLSLALSGATIGITTTPAYHLEKSGTVAAMLDHGLPVVCVARKWQPWCKLPLHLPPNTFVYKLGAIRDLLALKGNTGSPVTVGKIAEHFAANLLGRTTYGEHQILMA